MCVFYRLDPRTMAGFPVLENGGLEQMGTCCKFPSLSLRTRNLTFLERYTSLGCFNGEPAGPALRSGSRHSWVHWLAFKTGSANFEKARATWPEHATPLRQIHAKFLLSRKKTGSRKEPRTNQPPAHKVVSGFRRRKHPRLRNSHHVPETNRVSRHSKNISHMTGCRI